MQSEEEVTKAVLSSKAPISFAELVRRFRIKSHERRDFRVLLQGLEKRGKIARVRGKNYTAPSGRSSAIIGTLSVTARGFGFVKPDWSNTPGKRPFDGDLFIPQRNMGAALDGDLVRAEFLRGGSEGPSGRIEEVLEHAHKRIVGWYQRTGRDSGTVMPRSDRLDRRINVPPPPKDLKIEDYEWVEVEIENFTPAPAPLEGRIVARIGKDGDKGIDILLVLRDLGIIEEFPVSVEKEVEKMRFHWEKDLEGRVDYRELPTITIDPLTAKDFDDALSVEPLPGGDGWRLYVHIADVAHFLERGSALDTEALERATSVYPVDRVVPMLPSKLSAFLCSLRPHEDRLTMTAKMDISSSGKLLHSEIHSSVIHSDYRLTYEQAQAAIEGKDEETEPFKELVPLVHELRKVAAVLRKARFRRGALDLDIPETFIVFDEFGIASDIKFYPRFEAHQLVEECMLIANEAVAQFLTKKQAPLLYRIHEQADEDRLEQLSPALAVFGIKLHARNGEITPKDIQNALEQAQKHPAGHILRRLVLRALKRAEYDPENVGHFGLASDCYCHFTSPIRRYPDVIVHRQLKSIEAGRKLAYPANDNELDSLGEHCSSRERRAQEAEWEATAIKSLEFIKDQEGEEFDAYIAGVQSFGLFVELAEYPVEGLIKRASLTNDKYEMDEHSIMYVGRNTGHRLRLADKIRVRIAKVDPIARRLDLDLLQLPETNRAKTRKGRGGRR